MNSESTGCYKIVYWKKNKKQIKIVPAPNSEIAKQFAICSIGEVEKIESVEMISKAQIVI